MTTLKSDCNNEEYKKRNDNREIRKYINVALEEIIHLGNKDISPYGASPLNTAKHAI